MFSYWSLFLSFILGIFYNLDNWVLAIPIYYDKNLCGYVYVRYSFVSDCYEVSHCYLVDDDSDFPLDYYPAKIFYSISLKDTKEIFGGPNLRGYLDTFGLNYKDLFLNRNFYSFEVFNPSTED